MNHKQRRLLEMAGILRRNTPDHLLREGDDEGGDDPFADDSGDDSGDDIFGGDDDGGGEDESDDSAGDAPEDEGSDIGNRIPPKELDADDIKRFGSPRFKEVEAKLQGFFNQSIVSASAAAQNLESYPGVAIIDDDQDETPAMDAEEKEKAADEEKEKNESFHRYGNSRNKWLINEAKRLLFEAVEDGEGASPDEFDSEHFANSVANYMSNIHNTMDIEGGIFNIARQMILNNFGEGSEEEFCKNLAAIDPKYDFKGIMTDIEPVVPSAVGASGDAAG